MFAEGPDSVIYLDPFRLAAFRAPMMADVAELTVAEDPLTREQARANRVLNAASDALGEVLAVRRTDFGSVWFGERGYAVFAFEDTRVENGRATGVMLAGEAAIITR